MYREQLSKKIKKNIINIAIGKCGKTKNNKNISKIYFIKAEAYKYSKDYNGEVFTISSSNFYDTPCNEEELKNNIAAKFERKKVYLLSIQRNKKLEETLLPIQHFIYSNQRLKNLLLYRQLINNGFKCFGIKTDSIFTNAKEEELIKVFQFNNDIGVLKIENSKSLPTKEITFEQNIYETSNNKQVNVMYIDTEENFFTDPEAYNTEIKDKLTKYNKVCFFGLYAGVGKSFASQSNATKAIYITPYNVLCQELMIKGHKSITLHRLMSLNFTGDSSKRKHYDVSEYDSIVFEEIMQYSPKLLSAIHRFMNLHPDKKIIANGDLSQNMPILFGHNNILSEENYLMLCINSMFPNQIILQVPKRLDNEIDREKIKNIKDDIFNTKLNIMDVWRKYNLKIINNIDEITTTTNVSYFRSRSYNINEFVQNKLIHVANEYIEHEYVCNGKQYVFKYYVGQKIICRQCFRRNNCHLFTNYIYEILDIKEDDDEDHIITIRNINDYIPMTITSKQLSNISLPYSSTCHSIQGSTIHEPYTIFDTNIVYADRHWIYTALTRCTSLDQVTIFEHPKVECSILERCKFKQYYKLKVDNYIQQDIIAGRLVKTKENELKCKENKIDDYIDYNWFNEKNYDFKCYICGEYFDIELVDGKVNSNMTVDRLDNSTYHSKSNCKLCCLSCNVKKRDF